MPIPLIGQGPTPGVPPSPAPPPDRIEIEVEDETGAVRVREAALGAVAEALLRGIEADGRSRRDMIEQDIGTIEYPPSGNPQPGKR